MTLGLVRSSWNLPQIKFISIKKPYQALARYGFEVFPD
jgi:hypothetical protein